mmetsp:Transcript_102510/g.306237  ORF Transcript_102510/g.306237 Transcript_102510/m.306237 type:complete len:294 (-) Transcript_102510:225-1106(-)
MASRGKSLGSYGTYGSSRLSPTSAREKYAHTAMKVMTNRAGMVIKFAFTITGRVVANIHRNVLMMFWYGKGNGVSATFAAWLKAKCPSDTTCTMRLRIGASVFRISPAVSCFCRVVTRRMIQDSTMAHRAKDDNLCPSLSASSTDTSSSEMPPSTGNSSDQFRLDCSFAPRCDNLLRADVDLIGCSPRSTDRGTGAQLKLSRSESQRRCCRASACIRLNRCTSSSKKCGWSGPWYGFLASSMDRTQEFAATMEGCKNRPDSSALASKAIAMHAPSSHFEPILWTASIASMYRE